jgi:hypothetical protein
MIFIVAELKIHLTGIILFDSNDQDYFFDTSYNFHINPGRNHKLGEHP